MECRTLALLTLITVVLLAHDAFGINPRILSDSASWNEIIQQKLNRNGNEFLTRTGGRKPGKVTILYDSISLDREYQLELVTAVKMAFRHLNEEDLPRYIDLGQVDPVLTKSLLTSVQWIINHKTKAVVSLLEPQALSQFILIYEQFKIQQKVFKVFTPRLVPRNFFPTSSVQIFSLQMSQMGLSVALLNRVEKIGVRTLIPILDKNNPGQMDLLKLFIAAGQDRLDPIEFSSPLFVVPGEKSRYLKEVLNDERNAGLRTGILLLATRGSHSVMEVANESKNVLQMRWFSPNLLEFEEWALRGRDSGNFKTSSAAFGIYSVHFVGSRGWDNPSRRKMLRELGNQTDASPRILSSVLAYDAAWAARNYVKSNLNLELPLQGLSGEISFDPNGYRQEGLYYGVSAVPESVSPLVTLLQPSAWILEDVINIVEAVQGRYLITDYTDYTVATSSMLTKEELTSIVRSTGNSTECHDRFMEILTHDPFSQMANTYLFKKENIPYHILIPNQHGYGMTFVCEHADKTRTTLKIACTPGGRLSDPVRCFRSHFSSRVESQSQNRYRANDVYNGYGYPSSIGNPGKVPYSARDDSLHLGNTYDYGGSNAGSSQPTTVPTLTTRFDTPIISDDMIEASTLLPPLPDLPLHELKQLLKSSQPLVFSCMGASVGCVMFVLVLSRLYLGVLATTCYGCFVGVFGSCGPLVGAVFSATTVICTELFRQGYLDIDTFLADSEFGRLTIQESPMIHKGYKILAAPLVKKMRESKELTEIVAKFAIPWGKYMKYKLGYSEEYDLAGFAIHAIGSPICFLAGTIHEWTHSFEMENIQPKFQGFSTTATTALLSLTFTTLLFHRYFQSRQGINH